MKPAFKKLHRPACPTCARANGLLVPLAVTHELAIAGKPLRVLKAAPVQRISTSP